MKKSFLASIFSSIILCALGSLSVLCNASGSNTKPVKHTERRAQKQAQQQVIRKDLQRNRPKNIAPRNCRNNGQQPIW